MQEKIEAKIILLTDKFIEWSIDIPSVVYRSLIAFFYM